jgi:hypothetical protein
VRTCFSEDLSASQSSGASASTAGAHNFLDSGDFSKGKHDQKIEPARPRTQPVVLQAPEARNASPYSGKLARHTHTVWMHKRL